VPEVKSKESPKEHQSFGNRYKRGDKNSEIRNNAAKNCSVRFLTPGSEVLLHKPIVDNNVNSFLRKKYVNLSLSLIKQAPRHEDILGSGGIFPTFLTLALDGGECSASRPSRSGFHSRQGHSVQTGSGAHPALLPMGTGGKVAVV
jgi:hypothetical protein